MARRGHFSGVLQVADPKGGRKWFLLIVCNHALNPAAWQRLLRRAVFLALAA